MNGKIETADEAMRSILGEMYQGQTSEVDILADPEIDPNTVPVIRDAEDLGEMVIGIAADGTEGDIPMLDETDLEEITDEEPANAYSTYSLQASGAYTPRHALVVMGPGESNTAKAVGTAFAKQGMQVRYETFDMGAIGHINKNPVDVLVLGQEYDNIANYVERHSGNKAILTIGVSQNGMPADIKFISTQELLAYAQSGNVVKDYATNPDAQQYRKKADEQAEQLLKMVGR